MTGARAILHRYPRTAQAVGIGFLTTILQLATIAAGLTSYWNLIWILVIPVVMGLALNGKCGCSMAVVLVSVSTTISLLANIAFRADQPAIDLPRATGAAYRTSIRRYFDGEGLVCQPFQLNITFDRQPGLERKILSANQSDDVVIVQTPSVIYVFYNELVLTGFGAWVSDTRDPRPLLCDINIPSCVSEKQRLIDAGARVLRICGTAQRWRSAL
ncbi:MAG TPA: hypothetical protein VI168_15370 [Croceibacterium sp.]